MILFDDPEAVETGASRSSEIIEEVSEPSSPETVIEDPIEGPSMLASMLRRSPPQQRYLPAPKADQVHEEHVLDESEEEFSSTARPGLGICQSNGAATRDMTERAPLLTVLSNQSRRGYGIQNGRSHESLDLEGQKSLRSKSWAVRIAESFHRKKGQVVHLVRKIRDPKCWDRRVIWHNVVVTPVASLPAVIVGLLLNILDALSYGKDAPDDMSSQEAHISPGMILFPLGSPIFASLGSAGISIFYVSTIISQLTFSAGSIFRGGVGSELVSLYPHWSYLRLIAHDQRLDRSCSVFSQHGLQNYRHRRRNQPRRCDCHYYYVVRNQLDTHRRRILLYGQVQVWVYCWLHPTPYLNRVHWRRWLVPRCHWI